MNGLDRIRSSAEVLIEVLNRLDARLRAVEAFVDDEKKRQDDPVTTPSEPDYKRMYEACRAELERCLMERPRSIYELLEAIDQGEFNRKSQ